MAAALVRCKACGYVMPAGRLEHVCPACGALAQVFEPYQDPVGEKRRMVLDRHIHPIAVHFPTSFAVSMLVITLATLIFSGRARELFICTGQLMSLFLPFLVLAAFLAGVADGKTRFRRIDRSQILKRKILFGILFFACSVALTLLIWLGAFDSTALTVLSVVAAAGGLAFSLVLGVLGSGITNSAFPGK
jgi:uncharacterized membrane protein